jgi:shikimate dehydrogenase
MLIWQGALAFERWTGLSAPVARMRVAAEQSMGQSTQQPVAAVRVRRAAEQDIADLTHLHDLLQACHAERLPDFFKPASAPTLSPETLLALLADPVALIWVAEVDGVVAGYLYADTAPALETTTTYRLDRLWIHQLVVAAEYQGRGAGAALVAAARSHAHARAIGTVALSVWAFNERALRFFASQGFETYNCRMWIRSMGSPSSR